jgi:cell division protein FtsL
MVKVKLIIMVVTCVVVMAVIMTLSLTTAHFYHECSDLRRQLNQTGQTVQQLKQEVENREKIMAEKDELLEKVKQAKTYPDYIKIWNDLSKSLSSH